MAGVEISHSAQNEHDRCHLILVHMMYIGKSFVLMYNVLKDWQVVLSVVIRRLLWLYRVAIKKLSNSVYDPGVYLVCSKANSIFFQV